MSYRAAVHRLQPVVESSVGGSRPLGELQGGTLRCEPLWEAHARNRYDFIIAWSKRLTRPIGGFLVE